MNIIIGRYPRTPEEERANWPQNVGEPADRWEGWIEPESGSWIMFLGVDDDALLWQERELSGAVIGEPIRIPSRNPERG